MALGRATVMLQKLIPARFLTLTAHLVLTICIFWTKDTSVHAGLLSDYSNSEYKMRDVEFTIALALTIVCFLLEYMGFLSGVSMFNPAFSLLSTIAHVAGTIMLSIFILKSWSSHLYWYIFGCCSAFPAIVEVALISQMMKMQAFSQVLISN
uniref:Transmembrane protein 107 n=1 Tax=Trichuris muris TaxID=70415 RepID=A0A5S6Q9W8_TRIMR